MIVDAVVAAFINILFRIFERILAARWKQLSTSDVSKLKDLALKSSYSRDRELAIENLGMMAKKGATDAKTALLDVALNSAYSSEREMALLKYKEAL